MQDIVSSGYECQSGSFAYFFLGGEGGGFVIASSLRTQLHVGNRNNRSNSRPVNVNCTVCSHLVIA